MKANREGGFFFPYTACETSNHTFWTIEEKERKKKRKKRQAMERLVVERDA